MDKIIYNIYIIQLILIACKLGYSLPCSVALYSYKLMVLIVFIEVILKLLMSSSLKINFK